MSKLLKLICMAAIVTLLAGCGNKQDEPTPEPVTETWVMTYDNYQSILYVLNEDERQKYKNLSREVTILRDGEEAISIKGIFEEYPDAWVKGVIKGDKVYIGNVQPIGNDNGETVYFHWGYAEYDPGYRSPHTGIQSPSEFQCNVSSGHAFIISADENTLTATDSDSHFSFWYDNMETGYVHYYEERGYPDVDIKINVSFRKVSDAGTKNQN